MKRQMNNKVGKLTFGGTMTLAEIRPLLVVALIGLMSLSAIRSYYQKSNQARVRIPVRFEKGEKPRHIEIRRLAD